MNWLLTILLCIILVELVWRLPFPDQLKALVRSGKRASQVVRSKAVSDHWKEKAMGAYARKTFIATIKIAGLLAVALGLAALLVIVFDRLSSGFQSFILGWQGLGLSVVAASLYVAARKALARGRL